MNYMKYLESKKESKCFLNILIINITTNQKV